VLESRLLLSSYPGIPDDLLTANNYYIPDHNGNRITDIQTLVQEYSPVMQLDLGEPFHPEQVEIVTAHLSSNYSDKPNVYNQFGFKVANLDQIGQLAVYDSSQTFYGDYFIDLPGGTIGDVELTYDAIKNSYTDTIYATVVKDPSSDRLSVQYWFYYYGDDWLNVHEGDWEAMNIFFSQTGPYAVYYFQHNGGESLSWGDTEREGTHVLDYVGLGSHASYPHAGRDQYLADQHYGLGDTLNFADGSLDVRVMPRSNEASKLTNIDGRDMSWLMYCGHWGQYQLLGLALPDDGPKGPGMARDKFVNPLQYAPNPPDATPRVSILVTDPTAAELGADTQGQFTIFRTGKTDSDLEVLLEINGTADNGGDYEAINYYVTIPTGDVSVTVTVDPIPDDLAESTETVVVSLVDSLAYDLLSVPGYTTDSATVSIADVKPPNLRGDGFAVRARQPGPSGELTVDYTIENTGEFPATSFNVQFYLSSNSTISTTDVLVGGAWVSGVDAYGSVTRSQVLHLPTMDPFSTTNKYWVGMMIVPTGAANDFSDADNSNRGAGIDMDWIFSENQLPAPENGSVLAQQVDLTTLTGLHPVVVNAALGDEWIGKKDIDVFKFHAGASQRIGFDIDSTAMYSTYIRLFDSSWVELAANSQGRAPDDEYPVNSYFEYTFANGGDYYLSVSSGNQSADPRALGGRQTGQTGPYTLTFTDIRSSDLYGTYLEVVPAYPVPADGKTTVNFEITNGSTYPAGASTVGFYLVRDPDLLDPDVYWGASIPVGTAAVPAIAAGQTYSGQTVLNLPVPSPSLSSRDNQHWLAMMVDANHNVTEYNEDNNSNLGHGLDMDDISLDRHLPVPCDGTAVVADSISVGATVSASIGLDEWIGPEDLDTYQFSASAGQTLGFDIDVTSGNLNSALWLYDSQWNLLGENDNGTAPGETVTDSYLEYSFTATGQYYVIVGAKEHGLSAPDPRTLDRHVWADGGMGNYDLTVTALTGLTPQGPRVASISMLPWMFPQVTFNKPVKWLTVSPADVTVTGPGGQSYPPLYVQSPEFTANPNITYATTYWIGWATPLPLGTYNITIGPNIEDAAGNLMDQDGDRVGPGPTDANDVYHGTFVISVPSAVPTVSVTATDAAAAESGTPPSNKGDFTISRTGATTSPLDVSFSLAGLALQGADYSLTLGASATTLTRSVTIPAGAASVVVTVNPVDDSIIEGAETAILTLSSGGYTIDTAKDSATVIIADNDLATVSITASDSDAAETLASDTANTGTFRISRTSGTSGELVVLFKRSGTATSGGDYTLAANGAVLTGNSVTIPALTSSVDVRVTPADDTLPEPTETVILTLQANSAYTLPASTAQRAATVSIADNEPVVSIAANDDLAAETLAGGPANTGTFRVSRSGTSGVLTVTFTRTGTATFGAAGDYTFSAGGTNLAGTSVDIPDGQNHVDITVVPRDDAIQESTETAILTLKPGGAYSLAPSTADRAATVRILDNESMVSISAAPDSKAAETAAGATADTGTFRVSRGSTGGNLTVSFTRGGTAKFGPACDYTLSAGGSNLATTAVVIPDGQEYVDIVVKPVDDLLAEVTETVVLTLAPGAGYSFDAVVASRAATVEIADNEPSVSIAATIPSASETAPSTTGKGKFTITRAGNTSAALTVSFVRSGTAKSGTDYVLKAGGVTLAGKTVTMAAGAQSVDIDLVPVNDLLVEPAETVVLTLASGKTYTLDPVAGNRTATASIEDNEPTVSVAATIPSASETLPATTGEGVFTITRTSNVSAALTVPFVLSGTATRGKDYVLKVNGATLGGKSVSMAAGVQSLDVEVVPVDDIMVEPAETVVLTLATSKNYTLDAVLANRTATVSIADNEPTVSLFAMDDQAGESGTPPSNTGLFRVCRTGSLALPLTVQLTRAGTAASGMDMTAIPPSVTIPAGAAFADITVSPRVDLLAEPAETVILTLKPATSYYLDATLANRTATVSILDASAIVAGVVSITSTVLPNWSVDGQSHNFQLAASGGVGSLTWAATGLPVGFTLSAGGLLAGIAPALPLDASAAISPVFDITVTDSANPQHSQTLHFRITYA
jgi:hypothetical protein